MGDVDETMNRLSLTVVNIQEEVKSKMDVHELNNVKADLRANILDERRKSETKLQDMVAEFMEPAIIELKDLV